MAAPAVLREVFNAHRAAWGDEDDGITFDNGPAPVGRLDVLVYRPTAGTPMTSFTTIGMAVEPMPVGPGPGGGRRAELQFARRGPLSREDERAVAGQLANLAVHPFVTGDAIDWGHMIGLNRDFPTLPGCAAVLVSGPLTMSGRDYIRTSDGAVRILNVVPITEAERAVGRTLPPIEFVQRLIAETDIFAPRDHPVPG
jgi:hypothetical protein